MDILQSPRQSTQVGGHARALGSMVLREAKNTLRRMKQKIMPNTN